LDHNRNCDFVSHPELICQMCHLWCAMGAVRENLRFVPPDRHLVIQNELQEGSPELVDIFEREVIGANDTSAAVGYAPLREPEWLVLDAERWLNSPDFQWRFPEAGEDVKVMGVRHDRDLTLTVALAFVDQFVPDALSYFNRKEEMRLALTEYLMSRLHALDRVVAQLNTLDDPARGDGGMYLTLLGTSAEGGDCGQVGLGNRVNGIVLFSFYDNVSFERACAAWPRSYFYSQQKPATHYKNRLAELRLEA
jgi:S-adenosylmethionine synthetase